jgi:hypothetical protein
MFSLSLIFAFLCANLHPLIRAFMAGPGTPPAATGTGHPLGITQNPPYPTLTKTGLKHSFSWPTGSTVSSRPGAFAGRRRSCSRASERNAIGGIFANLSLRLVAQRQVCAMKPKSEGLGAGREGQGGTEDADAFRGESGRGCVVVRVPLNTVNELKSAVTGATIINSGSIDKTSPGAYW